MRALSVVYQRVRKGGTKFLFFRSFPSGDHSPIAQYIVQGHQYPLVTTI